MLANVLAVAAGGALGAVLRYGVGLGLASRSGFPWATLSVNVVGSLLFGLLIVWLNERLPAASELRVFLLVGVLGAFTTFSTFSWETLVLFEQGAMLRATMNIVGSVMLCVIAAAAGVWLARQIL